MDRASIRRSRSGSRSARRVRARAALLAVLVSLPAVTPATAITDEEIYGALRFALTMPGSRMAAMGGAGLALTEDATAASVNPARLGSIGEPETVLEGRMGQLDDMSGRSGLVVLDPNQHPFAGTSSTASSAADGITSPSYLGFAYPLRLRRPLVLAIASVRAIDVGVDLRSVTRTIPTSAPNTPSGGDEVIRLSRGRLDVGADLYHLAAGWRLTPTFSVGGAFVAGRMRLSSETVGLLSDPLQLTHVGMVDPRFSGTRPEPLFVTESDGTDTALAFSFGSWWRPLPSLAFATAYRRGPRFEFPGESRDLSSGARERFSNVFKVPDTSAAGVAWTPFGTHPSAMMQTLTFALDLERVETSDLLEGLREGEGMLTRPGTARGVSYEIEDSTEVRLGAEARRSFPTWTLALRGGLYTDHDERLRLAEIEDDPNTSFTGQGRALREGGFLLPDEDTDWHVTLGAGARLYSMSCDLAVDLSGEASLVVLTGAWRFREFRKP